MSFWSSSSGALDMEVLAFYQHGTDQEFCLMALSRMFWDTRVVGEERLPVSLAWLLSLAAMRVFTGSNHPLGTIHTSEYCASVYIIIRFPLQHPESLCVPCTVLRALQVKFVFHCVFIRWMLM